MSDITSFYKISEMGATFFIKPARKRVFETLSLFLQRIRYNIGRVFEFHFEITSSIDDQGFSDFRCKSASSLEFLNFVHFWRSWVKPAVKKVLLQRKWRSLIRLKKSKAPKKTSSTYFFLSNEKRQSYIQYGQSIKLEISSWKSEIDTVLT